MVSAAVALGTGAASSTARAYSLFVDGLDVLAQPAGTAGQRVGTDIDSVDLRERAGAGAELLFDIDDPANAITPREVADVLFVDHKGVRRSEDGSPAVAWHSDNLFMGQIEDLVPEPVGPGRVWHVRAVSLDIAVLDRRYVLPPLPTTVPAGIFGGAAMQGLLSNLDTRVQAFRDDVLSNHWLIGNGTVLTDPIAFAGMTIRQACKAINDACGVAPPAVLGPLYIDVDTYGHARWAPTDQTPPIVTLTEAEAPGTRPAPTRVRTAKLRTSLVNAVYVTGANSGIAAWVEDRDSILRYGRREYQLSVPWATTLGMAQLVAQTYLATHGAVVQASFAIDGLHDSLIEDADVTTGYWQQGWHVRARHTVLSNSGLWGPLDVQVIQSLHRTFRGNWCEIELDYGVEAQTMSGAFSSAILDTATSARDAGRLRGSLDEVAVRVKAGIPTDADFDSPRDGLLVVDTTNECVWIRAGSIWLPFGGLAGARYSSGAVQAGVGAGATSANMDWGTLVFDPDAGFDAVNDRYVIPRDGVYLAAGAFRSANQASAAGNFVRVNAIKNGATMAYGSTAISTGGTVTRTPILLLERFAAGDTLAFTASPFGAAADCALDAMSLARVGSEWVA